MLGCEYYLSASSLIEHPVWILQRELPSVLGNWSLSAKFLLLLGVPLAFQVALFLLLAQLQNEGTREATTMMHPIEVNAHLISALRDLLQIHLGASRGQAIYFLSPEFEETRRDGFRQVSALHELLKDDPARAVALDRTMKACQDLARFADEGEASLSTDRALDKKARRSFIVAGIDKLRAVEESIADVPKLIDDQSRLQEISVQRWKEKESGYRKALEAAMVAEAVLVLLLLVWFGRHIGSRFQAVQDNGYRLASRQPLSDIVGGADEIARVDAVFHSTAEALSQSERREHAIAENARDMICTLQDKLSFQDASLASQIVLGFTPEELLQRKLASLVDAGDLEYVVERLEKARSTGRGMFDCRMRRQDGKTIDTRWSVQYSGKRGLFFCVVHDNSERKEAERLRHELVQLVSHDLRKPLSLLRRLLDVAGTEIGALTERGEQLRAIASSATGQMLTLINDLLDMEELEAGALQLNRAPEPLEPLVEQAFYAVSALSSKHQVELKSHVRNLTAYVDRDRFVQILSNLLSNAVKFSPAGAPVLIEGAERGPFVELRVSDRGRGIPQALLPFIFDRFRQVERSDATQKGGAGLGLAICQSLVELHGGSIKVDSVVNQGTTFTISLPLSKNTEAAR
ncbi:MAG TPA: ATP-binding protein [Chroococcales cyanobacterium]